MSTKESAAARSVGRGVESNSSRKYSTSADPVEIILSRLERVRKSGQGWTAKCPAHQDRTASLSVASGEDSRVLLHCFAGCKLDEILGSLNLSMADVFPARSHVDMTFAQRAELREKARQSQWKAALNVLGLEAKIIVIAGRQIKGKTPLNAEDETRLDTALQRIDGAREVLFERR